MPRGVRHHLHSGVSSIQLLGNINIEILARPGRVEYDSCWGWPSCWSRSTELIDTSYPKSLQPIYSQLAWDTFLTSLNQNLQNTSLPECPILCCSLIPPIGCIYWYCRDSKTKERVEYFQDRIEEENQRIIPAGLMWTEPIFKETYLVCGCIKRIPKLYGSIRLQMDVDQRTQFELDNPQASQFMAARLLARSEASKSRLSHVGTPSVSHAGAGASAGGDRPADDAPLVVLPPGVGAESDQAKLLTRQATLARRNSSMNQSRLTHSTASHNEDTNDTTTTTTAPPTMSTADANARWSEPTQPSFQPILPDENSTVNQIQMTSPSQQVMA